ncbi:hypothetical protein HYALB_00006872 [Hymenoscyphus albidus]|uniref:Uncharacterized protein n=1 Tax=Hymenoscyphus albidus TaxID=595503 RepID=A0A9N9PYG4_9HELO|nr:hypothetical protein HYALB_00006872 [Hymenoscyphus albidus]
MGSRAKYSSAMLTDLSAQALREVGLYEDFLARARPEVEVLKIFNPHGELLMDEEKNSGSTHPQWAP